LAVDSRLLALKLLTKTVNEKRNEKFFFLGKRWRIKVKKTFSDDLISYFYMNRTENLCISP
jgi:hypothetical protein